MNSRGIKYNTYIDLFSGIGGFRSGLETNGLKGVAYSEVDKHAKKAYQAMFDTKNEVDLGDITQVTNEQWKEFKDIGFIVGGSPCQSFSVAGNKRGFEDTRGTLFFDYANAVKQVQPNYFLFENVKGLISHDKGETIRIVLSTFNEIGYDIDFGIFNSKDYGVPQSRERIYIVGKRKEIGVNKPKKAEKGSKTYDKLTQWAAENISYVDLLPKHNKYRKVLLKDILETVVSDEYYLEDDKANKMLNENTHDNHNSELVLPCLTPFREEKRQNGRRFKNNDEPSFTVNTVDRHGVAIKIIDDMYKNRQPREYTEYSPTLRSGRHGLKVNDGFKIRKLTPRECWRLQGFSDVLYDRAVDVGISKSQLYKQAGNAVTVNVVEAIVKHLIKDSEKLC